jgi:hypothetical protein
MIGMPTSNFIALAKSYNDINDKTGSVSVPYVTKLCDDCHESNGSFSVPIGDLNPSFRARLDIKVASKLLNRS